MSNNLFTSCYWPLQNWATNPLGAPSWPTHVNSNAWLKRDLPHTAIAENATDDPVPYDESSQSWNLDYDPVDAVVDQTTGEIVCMKDVKDYWLEVDPSEAAKSATTTSGESVSLSTEPPQTGAILTSAGSMPTMMLPVGGADAVDDLGMLPRITPPVY